MDWNRSETIALANSLCTLCHGKGLRCATTRKTPPRPCNCVVRSVFRACYRRFRDCALKERHVSMVTLHRFDGGAQGLGRRTWGRRDEEFVADFCLIARRNLEEFEHRIFRIHYLLGADWRLCCRQLNLDRGIFFHSVYRIQQKLGLVFRELQPYGLFPLDEYFGGKVLKALPPAYAKIVEITPNRKSRPPLSPPLRKVA